MVTPSITAEAGPARVALQQLLNGTRVPDTAGEEQILDFLGEVRRDPGNADFLKRLLHACDERTLANVENLLGSRRSWWGLRVRTVDRKRALRVRLLLTFAAQALAKVAEYAVVADMDQAGWFSNRYAFLEAALSAPARLACKYLQLSASLASVGRQYPELYDSETRLGAAGWAGEMELLQLRRAKLGTDLVYTGGTLEFRLSRERRFGGLSRKSAAVKEILQDWNYRDARSTYERAWRVANGLLLVLGLAAVVGWFSFRAGAGKWRAQEKRDACAWLKEQPGVMALPKECVPPKPAGKSKPPANGGVANLQQGQTGALGGTGGEQHGE